MPPALPLADQLLAMASGAWVTQMIHVAAELGLADALAAGVDGLIVVDLPPEEDDELCLPALAAGLRFIRLATPTTDDCRLPAVLSNTAGFVYYVSITGITGAAFRTHTHTHTHTISACSAPRGGHSWALAIRSLQPRGSAGHRQGAHHHTHRHS